MACARPLPTVERALRPFNHGKPGHVSLSRLARADVLLLAFGYERIMRVQVREPMYRNTDGRCILQLCCSKKTKMSNEMYDNKNQKKKPKVQCFCTQSQL
jgi:hypothetical protein